MPITPTILQEPPNATYACTGAFVDELARSGLHHAVICPGSRSTPLAMTFASHPTIRCWMHVDERSAAFFALGMAKRSNEPVALLCTSGTAAANFLPAIVEAHLTHVPLLVLTSDRPPELRDCGAPQTIDQHRLYGTHTKWFMETPLPEASNDALRFIRTLADRAVALTRSIPAGPVHLNMPFREPLVPVPLPEAPLPKPEERDLVAWYGRMDALPYVLVDEAIPASVSHAVVARLAQQITETPRGLLIAGPSTDPSLAPALLQLTRLTGYPLLADPLSQLRGKAHADEPIIVSYDAFLHNELFCSQYSPELVLRFGTMPTAKTLLLYLKQHAMRYTEVVVDPQGGWEEPTQLATQMIHADPSELCRQLAAELVSTEEISGERREWTQTWYKADLLTREALSHALTDFTELFEGGVFSELARLLPDGAMLYTGNSMPVRDMDTFFWPENRSLLCLGNRGASGIDGMISSALGASAAGENNESAILVIGDLSFFHDLNGLLAARLHHLNLSIVLVNNNGGGIFSFLPQAAYSDHFEQLFGTPTDLDFRPVTEMYGGTFQRVADWENFCRVLKMGLTEGGLHVIELQTERESNVRMHRQLWQIVNQVLEKAGVLTRNEQ